MVNGNDIGRRGFMCAAITSLAMLLSRSKAKRHLAPQQPSYWGECSACRGGYALVYLPSQSRKLGCRYSVLAADPRHMVKLPDIRFAAIRRNRNLRRWEVCAAQAEPPQKGTHNGSS